MVTSSLLMQMYIHLWMVHSQCGMYNVYSQCRFITMTGCSSVSRRKKGTQRQQTLIEIQSLSYLCSSNAWHRVESIHNISLLACLRNLSAITLFVMIVFIFTY